MTIVLLVAGVCLVTVVFVDALATTILVGQRGRPLSALVSTGVWRLLRRAARDPTSKLLAVAGPVTVLAAVATWIVLLWLGWFLVWSAVPETLTAASNPRPVDGWTVLYFTGGSLFSLGLGDVVPNTPAAQLGTVMTVLSGLFLVTLAITYLVPVVGAVVERRRHAVAIAALGESADEIVMNTWDGRSFDYLARLLPTLANDIARTAQQHQAYPVLHYFHSSNPGTAFAPAVAALDDAVTVLQHGVDEAVRPHPAGLRSLRTAVTQLLSVLEGNFIGLADEAPPAPSLERLKEAGIPVADGTGWDGALADLDEHRRRLRALVEDSGWSLDWMR